VGREQASAEAKQRLKVGAAEGQSANKPLVAGGTKERKVYVWTLADDDLVATLEVEDAQEVKSIDFQIDSALLVSGYRGGRPRFWSTGQHPLLQLSMYRSHLSQKVENV
jgi:hypothetical protein